MFDDTQAQKTDTNASPESRELAKPDPATHAVVDAWFAKHFHGLGAGVPEELYNRIHASKEDLKSILAQRAGETPAS